MKHNQHFRSQIHTRAFNQRANEQRLANELHTHLVADETD